MLLLIRSLSNPGGGAERVLAEVSNGLAAIGNDVTVASFDAPEAKSFYPFSPEVRRLGLSVGDPQRSTSSSEAVRRAVRIRSVIRRVRPDVVVAFMHSTYSLAAFAACGTGVPLIASEHIGMAHYRLVPAGQRAMMRIGQRAARAVTIPSSSARESFPRRLAQRMTVIPNPVALASPTDPTVRPPVVLFVGRLEPQKDPATLVAAFEHAIREHPNWRLRFVGDGPLRAAIEQEVAERNLVGRVDLMGYTSRVSDQMRDAAILAAPSRYESFGLAVAEGLAHGLPCIGFADCPGVNELIIDQVNGYLVSGSDRVAAMGAALSSLMADEATRLRMARAAPSTVARLSLTSTIEAWDGLIRMVAAPHDTGRS